MSLEPHEFIRRFLQHVLPTGFVRIRHGGFLANKHRRAKLERCRELLNVPAPSVQALDWKELSEQLTGRPIDLCPFCNQGHMICVRVLPKVPLPLWWRRSGTARLDSS
jgi:hypothetical protein